MAIASRLFVLIIIAAVILAGCTSRSFETRLHVDSYFNEDGNYGNYRTFAWVDYGTDLRVIEDAATRTSVTNAIEKVMYDRGLKYDEYAPDLRIGYHGATERQLDQVAVDSYYHEGNYDLDTSPGKKIDSWDVGTLMLMIFDAKDGTLLWRASAQAELDEKRVTQRERRERIELAIQKMLETFPTEEDVRKAMEKKGK
jgi:hypothetical protein